MAGGLLNLVSYGNANVILNGNPSKTFFKVTYSKYTNFGLQKFRLDYDGTPDLNLTTPSTFKFKIKRYADLLMDTYLVLDLPNIWSPAWGPDSSGGSNGPYWAPYEFKWIDNIGAQIISEIEVRAGSVTIQRYSGQYLYAMMQREFTQEKRDLFNAMSGGIPELTDPANNPARTNAAPYLKNTYPTASYTSNGQQSQQGDPLIADWFTQNLLESSPALQTLNLGAEPSIRGRTLYIPLNLWFCLDSRCAFPLISMQYTELTIQVTLRPIQEWFCVRDVFDISGGTYDNTGNILYGPYIQPNFTQDYLQPYRFLQTPPGSDILPANYPNKMQTWNADVHLLSTYCFLSNEEQQLFAAQEQVYLIKDIYEYDFLDILGTTKVKLNNSNRMVSSWMWFFQRNDVFMRNQWTNYSNWAYDGVIPANYVLDLSSGLYVTGPYKPANQRGILQTMGILLTGDYRETDQPAGVYDYVEKYTRTSGFAKEGLYMYNFCLNTNSKDYQPSGAINMSRFKNVELDITTYLPPIEPSGNYLDVLCAGNNAPISISTKPAWALYPYSYNMHVMEEQYNILSFVGGNCGLMYAR
jgi:hypothetical protein